MDQFQEKSTEEITGEEVLKIFMELREDGIKNPMTEEDIDDFIATVRRERRAARGDEHD